MAPQLYLSMYKEQFTSPGRVKREQLRPTSAHRRNNPQPRPDFLFPKSLQSSYRPRRTLPHPSPPGDTDGPLFPPVKHLSFHSPVTTCPDNSDKPTQMPPVSLSAAQALPSVHDRQKLQLTEPPAGPGIKIHPAFRIPARHHTVAQLQTRPQTGSLLAAQSNLPRIQQQSGCCSCFHVVKPYQAGHYIIHPEFVSECPR